MRFLKSGLQRAILAGACASAAHAGLMWLKTSSGVLPEFHPYDDLQRTIASGIGALVPQPLLWTIAFLNGALLVSFVFHRIHHVLPGQSLIAKGLVFGALAWVMMASVLFPLIGEGFFASGVGRGFLPALLSLAMLLVYGVTLSAIYCGLTKIPDRS
jgi:uncharacterized protein DUF6789